jgi:hypothetical protein
MKYFLKRLKAGKRPLAQLDLWPLGVLLGVLLSSLSFQNCAGTSMSFSSPELSSLASAYGANESFVTNEDTALYAKPVKTISLTTNVPAKFVLLSQSANGTVSEYNSKDGSFKYMPNASYVGDDFFEYSEFAEGTTSAVNRRISISVQPVYENPWLDGNVFNFPMNSIDNSMPLVGKDKKDPSPRVLLDLKGTVTQTNTQYGTVKRLSSGMFLYTPRMYFRGLDQLQVFVVNSAGLSTKATVMINIGNPFLNLEPALAVRGPGCMNCHANVASRFITDFGLGNNYFFAKPANPFTDAPMSMYGDHAKSWLTASFGGDVIVPAASMGLNLVSIAGTAYAGAENSATTVLEYVNALEARKTGVKAKSVTAMTSVFIGAPSNDLLNLRTGGTGAGTSKFLKNNADTSPNLSGLLDQGTYFEANSTGLVCDGDLVLSKTLYLNNLVLKTNFGCRIYSTQPIFVQGAITYQKLDASATDNTNLQLVSTLWVNLGVGDSHCESASNPGWYSQNSDTLKMKPSEHRLITYSAPTRSTQTVDAARAANYALLTELRKIPTFEDASCRKVSSGLPREVHFERLLINAPRVDSRYIGPFTGVIVTEAPLMSLNAFSFTYDPVFNRVPVLPLMTAEDFLVVK